MTRYVKVLESDAAVPRVAGVPAEWKPVEDLGTGGITNSAGVGVVPVTSDAGGNLVASRITDDGSEIEANSGVGKFYAGNIDGAGKKSQLYVDGVLGYISFGDPDGDILFQLQENVGTDTAVAAIGDLNGNVNNTRLTVDVANVFAELKAGLSESVSLDGVAHTIIMQATNGVIMVPPTTDPHVAGALWNNAGTLAISAG